jgi:peptidoglycan/LPS O-acetylase OafA/YrhL
MDRNQNIELIRIFSAFGIVLFHSGAPPGGGTKLAMRGS